jgi:predicted transcriptional regulator
MLVINIMLSNLRREIELLRRHVLILDLVMRHEPVGIIKLSSISDLPQHKVRYSLRVLEQRGLIKPSQQGAVATEKARKYRVKLYEEALASRKDFESLLEGMMTEIP